MCCQGMAHKKLGIGAPGILGPGSSQNPNLGLDTFELCRGMVLEPSCEIGAWRNEVTRFLGYLAEVGSRGEQAGSSCARTILPGVFSRGENKLTNFVQRPAVTWTQMYLYIQFQEQDQHFLELELSVVPSPPSLLPSLPSFLSSFLPL